jgi:hypothetical protein
MTEQDDSTEELPELDEGDTEELPGGDEPEETEDTLSPFREITEQQMEDGRMLGQVLDPENDESGTEADDEEAK